MAAIRKSVQYISIFSIFVLASFSFISCSRAAIADCSFLNDSRFFLFNMQIATMYPKIIFSNYEAYILITRQNRCINTFTHVFFLLNNKRLLSYFFKICIMVMSRCHVTPPYQTLLSVSVFLLPLSLLSFSTSDIHDDLLNPYFLTDNYLYLFLIGFSLSPLLSIPPISVLSL